MPQKQARTKRSTGATRRPHEPHFITLREAAAMVMSPENPDAAYPELDAATERTARVFVLSQTTSRVLTATALALIALAVLLGVSQGIAETPATLLAAIATTIVLAVLSHPLALRKTLIGKLLLPPEPEPVRDLFNRLARGEFTSHWGDDSHAVVDIADIRTVIADRREDAKLSPDQAERQAKAANRKIRDLSVAIPAQPMQIPDNQIVEPANLDELNAAPSGAYLKINSAMAFIAGGGDPGTGAALLRSLERQSNAIIRQPGSQYMTVGDLRAFLKENEVPGVKPSPWDGTR